jgi:hypothetical protein
LPVDLECCYGVGSGKRQGGRHTYVHDEDQHQRGGWIQRDQPKSRSILSRKQPANQGQKTAEDKQAAGEKQAEKQTHNGHSGDIFCPSGQT